MEERAICVEIALIDRHAFSAPVALGGCNRLFAEGKKGKIGELGVNGLWETGGCLKMESKHEGWNAEHNPCDASRAGSGVGWVDPGMLCCSMLSTSLEFSFGAK